jgi:sulfonate transport system ATP-binding protein
MRNGAIAYEHCAPRTGSTPISRSELLAELGVNSHSTH